MFPSIKCRAIQIEDCLKIEKSKVLNVSARFPISDSSFTLSSPRSLFSLHYLAYLWSAPGEKSTVFQSRIFYHLWLDCRSWDSKNFTSIYHYDLSYMGHFPFFKLSKLSKPQSQYSNVSQKGRKGQITATSIHQQSLLTSRICKHALCSSLGGPSRREPRSRKTSRFWKHVQWGSGVAARPHISTVIWTAT